MANDTQYEDWPIPDSYLTEIGRISALWAVLEDLLNFGVARLFGFQLLDEKQVILFNI